MRWTGCQKIARRLSVVVIGVLASVATPHRRASAQALARVHGLIVDSRSGKPVSGAVVKLEDSSAFSETSDRGRFTLSDASAGKHTIVVQRLGYETRRAEIELKAGTSVDLEIQLSTKPIDLDPIEVVVRSGRLAEVGYYDRRDNGGLSGRYITHDDLVHRNTTVLTDALTDIPGVKVFYLQPGRTTIRFNRQVTPRELRPGSTTGRLQYALDPPRNGLDLRGCEPDLYIDGRLYANASPPIVSNGSGTNFGATLNRVDDFNAVPVSEIEGVEIYVGAAVPSFAYNTACGVIVLWTRR